MIGRRAILAGAVASAAGRALAQARRMRVGFALAEAVPAYLDAFKRELEQLGWREGAGVEFRLADSAGDPGSLTAAVAALVAWPPDVIVSSSNRTHFAVRDATQTIPVVVVSAIDPVRLGVSDSIARPSRNFTGSIGFIDKLMEKRIELLREVMPKARRIALHLDPSNPAFPATRQGADEAARLLGLEIVIAGYSNRGEVVPSLDQAKAQGADAVIVIPDPLALPQMDAIAARAAELGLPTLGLNDNELRLGLTFVLGSDRPQLWREAAQTADRILRGTKVADIPFQQPTKVHTGINLRAAKALGIEVPLAVLARADEVIE
jgi:putative ABC transport system substrate-binding protein